ncbi:MAG: glycosyltransferase family 4 protein [Actinobacteria bacterium]|nr:glycosyltransferase family 4 protein [Actinomycetota bacterium]
MTARVGMIAPISHPYPPAGYGPWERVTHDLTERLVADGHDVTLFAPRGSITNARLVETVPAALETAQGGDPRLEEQTHLAIAMEAAAQGQFDLVHSHLHVHALPFSRLIEVPLLSTLHGAAWDKAHHPLLRRYADNPFVSISDRERAFLPELNYVATIPHGLAIDEIEVGAGDGGYLVFLGRLAPEKAPDLAMEVAERSGLPLLMAGPIDEAHRDYFDWLMGRRHRGVDYLGPLERSDVWGLLGEATALLMPLRWDEPFGLVVVEALAVGTPVVAWSMGAMPEIVEDGSTGFVVEDVDGAVAALENIGDIERANCRRSAETSFSDARMAADYSSVYERLVTPSR